MWGNNHSNRFNFKSFNPLNNRSVRGQGHRSSLLRTKLARINHDAPTKARRYTFGLDLSILSHFPSFRFCSQLKLFWLFYFHSRRRLTYSLWFMLATDLAAFSYGWKFRWKFGFNSMGALVKSVAFLMQQNAHTFSIRQDETHIFTQDPTKNKSNSKLN